MGVEHSSRGIDAAADRLKTIPVGMEVREIGRGQRVQLAPVGAAALTAEDRFDGSEIGVIVFFIEAVHGNRAAGASVERAQPDIVLRDEAELKATSGGSIPTSRTLMPGSWQLGSPLE